VPGLLNNASLHVVTVHYDCLPSGISAHVFDLYNRLTFQEKLLYRDIKGIIMRTLNHAASY
jgi:hypothetical protein